jgi:hypothetical protein
MRIPRPSSRSGFTLIEVAISTLFFVLMMSVLGVVTMTSESAYKASTLATKLDGQGRRALVRVSDELTTISGTLMNPDPTGAGGTDQIEFQQAVGVANGAVVWGALTRIGFEYDVGEVDDGQDNDGDGMVDEGVLVFTRDIGVNQARVVLCHDVRELAVGEVVNGIDDNGNGVVDEGGFSIQRVGDVMVIRLWLETSAGGGETVGRQHQTRVRLRNIGI